MMTLDRIDEITERLNATAREAMDAYIESIMPELRAWVSSIHLREYESRSWQGKWWHLVTRHR